MIIKDYTVISGRSDDLSDRVRDKLKEGWKLYGNIILDGSYLHQAMIFEEYESESTCSTTTSDPLKSAVSALSSMHSNVYSADNHVSIIPEMGYLSYNGVIMDKTPIHVPDVTKTVRHITKSPNRHEL